MNSLGRQALAILLSGMLAGLPLFASSPRGLVGIAQGKGTIQINGQPFGGQASLFSGDRILTGEASPLTVISSPAERFRFEPGTSAEVARENQANVVRLNVGTVEFRTAGATKTLLPNGVTVQPASRTVTLAQVSRLENGTSKVAVYKGSVEVADATENVTVGAGHTAILGADTNSSDAQTNDQNKKHKKKVLAIVVTGGLTAGAVAAILANEQTNFVSKIDP
jgi:ferric-dicitrate binding protein FerR (iron transport regulator)